MRCLARRCWRRRVEDVFCAKHFAEFQRITRDDAYQWIVGELWNACEGAGIDVDDMARDWPEPYRAVWESSLWSEHGWTAS